ncbi:MAG: DUF4838 domain-containing protein [Bacteroidales bacterium]
MRLLLALFLILLLNSGCSGGNKSILIATGGQAKVCIVVPELPTVTERFAAEELRKYLGEISGADFEITTTNGSDSKGSIQLETEQDLNGECYRISSGKGNIIITGNSDRALLYAVYDLLERIGCKWLAPGFDFYGGQGEIIPKISAPKFPSNLTIQERPLFTYRKLDIAEGRSLDSVSLLNMVEWMPKMRLNTLMFPMDQNNSGRTRWEDFKWLETELQKRAILLEVGQHGYQNFLNSGMESGTLFTKHPEWFGKDSLCNPDPSAHTVFNTSNKEALDYFTNNFLSYIESNPAVGIFDLWPPDFAKWQQCGEDFPESPGVIQAKVTESVLEAVREAGTELRLQMIAFDKTLQPVPLDEKILVDICPIHQNFESQIYDSSSVQNMVYAEAIRSWREQFDGELGIYTYYRKYAWKSLPNIIPHYMQNDLKWYASIPVQGISCYAEPGDWLTYELNHFILAKLEWNPVVNVDSLISIFCRGRFGNGWELGKSVYAFLENTVRFYSNIKGSSLKPALETALKIEEVDELINAVIKERGDAEPVISEIFTALLTMLQYLKLDLELQQASASGLVEEDVVAKLHELRLFLSENNGKGRVIFNENTDIRTLGILYKIND